MIQEKVNYNRWREGMMERRLDLLDEASACALLFINLIKN